MLQKMMELNHFQIGLIPANFIMAWLGHRLGHKVFIKRPFCWIIKKDTLQKSVALIQKHGLWAIFATRFTPIIRAPVYLAVGISKFDLIRFIKTDFVASCFQIPLVIFLGSLVGRSFSSIEDVYRSLLVLTGAMLLVSVIFLIMRTYKKPRYF